MAEKKYNLSLDQFLMLALSVIILSALVYAFYSTNLTQQKNEALVASYCTQCHSLPSPSQLPQKTWPQVLDTMESFYTHPDDHPIYSKKIAEDFIYQQADFEIVRRYFLKNAPTEQSIRQNTKNINWHKIPADRLETLPITLNPHAMVVSLNYDSNLQKLFVSETGASHQLSIFDQQFKPVNRLQFDEAPIDVFADNERLFVTLMGNMSDDTFTSAVHTFNLDKINHPDFEQTKHTLLEGHSRATQTLHGDFDHDGNQDIFYAGFGANSGTGYVSIFWGQEDGSFIEQRLFDGSGALKVEEKDFNNDGLSDFLVLIAQSSPKVILFESNGKRTYTQNDLITRPVGWGYMDFALVDLDNDGIEEIITAVGNNMELNPQPLKPYHGIYIWKNQGNNSFTQQQFFPMSGASQIIAADFDGDGSIDIAATSMMPDWEAELPVTFMALLQKQTMKFKPYTLDVSQWQPFTLITSLPINNNDSQANAQNKILLTGGQLPYGLPENPDIQLSKKLQEPGKLVVLDLYGLE